MGDRAAKDALFEALASVAKALGNGHRAEIIDVLAQGERSVEELAVEIAQSIANTSHHLRVLARAGVLTTRRDGTRVYYRLASERVADLWAAMRDVATAHVADLDRLARAYLGAPDGVEEISRDELAQRVRAGDIIVLDVRPATEYEAGHVLGARSVPITELRRHLRDLPADADIVAYCRGPYCVYANEAVKQLRRRGYRARRLQDGYPEWQRSGRPVAIGQSP
jgi:rhodanese-related sulfurtransferase/DNA-binding transcriptional ArsR family regulator